MDLLKLFLSVIGIFIAFMFSIAGIVFFLAKIVQNIKRNPGMINRHY